MGAKEKKLTNETLLDLKPNQRRFRINAGSGWVGSREIRGSEIHRYINAFGSKGCLLLIKARKFKAAPEGWPDLFGWDEITITPEMVGQKIAIACGDEIKATGRLRAAQKKFGECLTRMGGIFRVVRAVSNASTPREPATCDQSADMCSRFSE